MCACAALVCIAREQISPTASSQYTHTHTRYTAHTICRLDTILARAPLLVSCVWRARAHHTSMKLKRIRLARLLVRPENRCANLVAHANPGHCAYARQLPAGLWWLGPGSRRARATVACVCVWSCSGVPLARVVSPIPERNFSNISVLSLINDHHRSYSRSQQIPAIAGWSCPSNQHFGQNSGHIDTPLY